MKEWHDLRITPEDLPKEEKDVLIAWSNCYCKDETRPLDGKDYIKYVIAGRYYMEPGEDENYDPGYYWIDEDYNNYPENEVIAWCELPEPPEEMVRDV